MTSRPNTITIGTNMNEKQRIQWQPLVELIVVLLTILGSTIPLYLHTDSKLEASMSKMDDTLQGIREEIRDFHTKLALQDQEYKNHLIHMHKEWK